MNQDSTPPLTILCRAAGASALDLVALAVARGCRHYAEFAAGHPAPRHLDSLQHESLLAPKPSGTDMVRRFDGGSALIEQWLRAKDTPCRA